ncbi:MAG: hypothetical protein PHP00_05415 [Thiotrichaceae bacterium]|nr:hypothetical protein [Thiotrichaceae bacterium]
MSINDNEVEQDALLILMCEKLLVLEKALILSTEADVRFKLKHDIQALKQDIAERRIILKNSCFTTSETLKTKYKPDNVSQSHITYWIWSIPMVIGCGLLIFNLGIKNTAPSLLHHLK